MKCPFCKENIPHLAPVCYSCLNDTKFVSNNNNGLPPCDMYGHQITEIYVDEQKNEARETTVASQYLTSKITKDENEKKANKKYGIIGISGGIIFFVMIVLFDIFFTIGLVKTEEDISSIFSSLIGSLIFILFGAGMAFLFICGNIGTLDENKGLNEEIKKNKIHKNKERYYYSDRVFGFFDCCHFYEIDKTKIQNIRYDTLNSEYVLTMLDQTFMNYEFAPTQEFLIPDVFDDTELSIALGLDLPAKYMEF